MFQTRRGSLKLSVAGQICCKLYAREKESSAKMLLRVLQRTANGIQSVFFALQDVTLCRRRPDQGDGEAERAARLGLQCGLPVASDVLGYWLYCPQAPREFESS